MAMNITIHEFTDIITNTQAKEKLNLGDDWSDTILAIYNNDGNCTCQLGEVKCPCPQGLARAHLPGGKCYCDLFVCPPGK